MDKITFESKQKKIKTDYRAYCKNKNNHWKGVWRNTYSEAYNDAEAHRNNNPMHDIKIEERTYSEASI